MPNGRIFSGTFNTAGYKTGDDHMFSTLKFGLQDGVKKSEDLVATIKQTVGAEGLGAGIVEIVEIDKGSWAGDMDYKFLRDLFEHYYLNVMLGSLPIDVRGSTNVTIGNSIVYANLDFNMESTGGGGGTW